MRVLANAVNVIFAEQRGPTSHDNFRVSATIYRDGLVNSKQMDELVEEEIVELRPVGPEDSEYFLTDYWRELLGPQIRTLHHDWFKVTPDPWKEGDQHETPTEGGS
ncbi:MAG TPA: hypothetical protein VFU96_02280 [Acidimicrobiia bacterium]|nr:hypothetical protein [Acidimicrobiia bacterium]